MHKLSQPIRLGRELDRGNFSESFIDKVPQRTDLLRKPHSSLLYWQIIAENCGFPQRIEGPIALGSVRHIMHNKFRCMRCPPALAR
jgi:hypothetical protein